MTDSDRRLEELEKRLQRIEEALQLEPILPPDVPDSSSTSESPDDRSLSTRLQQPVTRDTTKKVEHRKKLGEQVFSQHRARQKSTATMLMAVGAALSFVLAAAYFIGLVYDAGWLTPPIQLGIALTAGLTLIVAGVVFARHDRDYASYLPAVGTIVLYLTVYGGHLFYDLIPGFAAMILIAGISVGALVLGRRFENSAYSVLAAAGVYVTPLLLGEHDSDLTALMIYFTVWSLLFSFLSLQEGSRATYLVAMYMALFCFDATWRISGESSSWAAVAVYQFVQFIIFSATAAYFSVRHKHPMGSGETVAHALPLFCFYLIEYILLHEHAPGIVPIAGLASVAAVLGLYIFARRHLDESASDAAAGLVSIYCAVVTAHILFFELTPTEYLPWAVLVLPGGLALLRTNVRLPASAWAPLLVVTTVVSLWGGIVALASDPMDIEVPLPNGVLLIYAAMIYLAYALLSRSEQNQSHMPFVLYAGHITFMVATIRIFDSGLLISIVWGVFAVVLLCLALKLRDRILGQSSLLVFTASAAKVLLHDLAGSPTPVRIGTLVALGASLYIGGWLYQSLVRDTATYHPDPLINRQLRQVAALVRAGMDDAQIVEELRRRKIRCQHPAGWNKAIIARIRSEFELS